MADLILSSCTEVRKAVIELRDMKNLRKITDAMVAINSIENQADDIFDMEKDFEFLDKELSELFPELEWPT